MGPQEVLGRFEDPFHDTTPGLAEDCVLQTTSWNLLIVQWLANLDSTPKQWEKGSGTIGLDSAPRMPFFL
jgi:hypothetical protein